MHYVWRMATELRPMSEFDPGRSCLVHDQLNEQLIEWQTAWKEEYKRYAHDHAPGVIDWYGLLLDGWLPLVQRGSQ